MRFVSTLALCLVCSKGLAQECSDTMTVGSTFCEVEKFGIDDNALRDEIASRIEVIVNNPSGLRGGELDDLTRCALGSDESLADAYRADGFATRELIADILEAGGLVACRTDPKSVLELLSRVKVVR